MSDTVKARLPCEHGNYDSHWEYEDDADIYCSGGEVVELRWERKSYEGEIYHSQRLVSAWEAVDG